MLSLVVAVALAQSPPKRVDLVRRGIADYRVVAVDQNPWSFLLPELINVLRTGLYPRPFWREPDGSFASYGKLCGPLRPVIAYRFQTPDGFVELLICFGCEQAEVFYRGQVGTIHIDRIKRRLLDLAFWSFPLDPVLLDVAEGYARE